MAQHASKVGQKSFTTKTHATAQCCVAGSAKCAETCLGSLIAGHRMPQQRNIAAGPPQPKRQHMPHTNTPQSLPFTTLTTPNTIICAPVGASPDRDQILYDETRPKTTHDPNCPLLEGITQNTVRCRNRQWHSMTMQCQHSCCTLHGSVPSNTLTTRLLQPAIACTCGVASGTDSLAEPSHSAVPHNVVATSRE